MRQGCRGRIPACTLAIAALAMAALLLSEATLPHLHVGPDTGLWNQNHDLVYLATLAPLSPAPPAPSVAPLATGTWLPPVASPAPPETPPLRHTNVRAPPSR